MKILPALFLTSLLLLTVGCGGTQNASPSGSGTPGTQQPSANIFDVPAPKTCNLATRKKFVNDVMHDSYLWADETPVINYTDNVTYPDDEAVLNALRSPHDRFSFIMTQTAYDNFFQAGKNIGYGIYFQLETENANSAESNETIIKDMAILMVYPGSPADRAGIRRSDKITAIDGYSVNRVFHDANLSDYYFEEEKPVTASFILLHRNGTTSDVNVTKAEYDVKSVIRTMILTNQNNNTKVGYLLFQSFVGSSEEELKRAFSIFKEAGVDDLVLDLRYNGGGYVYIADQLSSLIAGWRAYDVSKREYEIFNQTLFNHKYSRYNSLTRFIFTQNAISLPRVFILTTKNTCSASELVINSLRAKAIDVDVIQIGEATCGKPYGMYPLNYCDHYLLAVDTRSANADGVGDYVNGIAPMCKATDDITHDFGDPAEGMLEAALYFRDNSRCQAQNRARALKQTTRKAFGKHGYREQYAIY
jgi:C-terminal processing protease CtpA/Prc